MEQSEAIIDGILENCKSDSIYFFTFLLALANAADAVEIICVGFIMSELDVSTQDEGG